MFTLLRVELVKASGSKVLRDVQVEKPLERSAFILFAPASNFIQCRCFLSTCPFQKLSNQLLQRYWHKHYLILKGKITFVSEYD